MDVLKLRLIYTLKTTYRDASCGDRKESSAEHTWSAMMLADYFLDKVEIPLDRQRVFALLLYHDLVEIEVGDTPIGPQHDEKGKDQREIQGAEALAQQLPMGKKFLSLFKEFQEGKTPEAKFARAIDKLDATIHELDYKEDWKGWTEEFARAYHEPYFKDFPAIREASEQALVFCREQGYFDQATSMKK